MNWKLIVAGAVATATVGWAAYEWFKTDDAEPAKEPKPEAKAEPEPSECDKAYQECYDILDEIRRRRGTEEEFLDAFSKRAEEALKRARARRSASGEQEAPETELDRAMARAQADLEIVRGHFNSDEEFYAKTSLNIGLIRRLMEARRKSEVGNTTGEVPRNNTWSQEPKRNRNDPWQKSKSMDQRLAVWDSLWRGFTQVPVRDSWYQGEQPVGILKDPEILEMLKDVPAVAFLTVDNRQGLVLRQGKLLKIYYQVTSGGINIQEWRDTPAGGWGKPLPIDAVINNITRAKRHQV